MQQTVVLIPNYNGEKFIKNTINSILDGFEEVSILVVDDVSTDNSIEVIEGLSNKHVKLIKRDTNGGFAASVNSGLKYCIENNIEFVIVANSDIIVSKENCMDITSQFLKLDNEKISVLGFLEEGVDLYRENENISGFFFALRLSTVKEIGYFDETFYMYGEEQDFFGRVIKHGYSIVQTGIKISHLCERSSSSNLYTSWLSIRNSIYLESKQNNILKVIKKIIVLFMIINRIYKPKIKDDPSLNRLYRPGVLKGNILLFKAIIWNIAKKIGVVKNAK